MKRKRMFLGILLAVSLLLGEFGPALAGGSCVKAQTVGHSASVSEQISLLEMPAGEGLVSKTGVTKSYIKKSIIQWAIKNINVIIEKIIDGLHLKKSTARKLRKASHLITAVFRQYENAKQVAVDTLTAKLKEALSKKMGYSSGIIASFIGKILSAQDDGGSTASSHKKGKKYILPFSAKRKVTASDLQGLSAWQLKVARNEIYARHGRLFQDSKLQNYFNSKKWYNGYIQPEDFVDSVYLSKLEKRNAEFILQYENS